MEGLFTVTAGEVIFKDSKLQGYIIKLEHVKSEKSLLGVSHNHNSSVEGHLDSSIIRKGPTTKFYFLFD